MSKKLKKWQITEEKAQLKITREKERSAHLIQCKIKENEQLKNRIKALEEVNAIKDGIIQVLVGRHVFGQGISSKELSYAIKHPERLKIEITKHGYRLKA